MKKSLSFFLGLVSGLIFNNSCSTPSENYYTGLKVYEDFDSTRSFDTTSDTGAPFYFRPVKIDLFYPSAENPKKQPLSYGDILDMYEQRMNYNISIDSYKKVSSDLANSISEYLHVDSSDKILSYKTEIYKDIKLPVKRFPLIIYAASMNGSSWENPVLFDSLAKAGFVVAAISSVGKFPGFMSDAVDLNEQVQDILFAKQKMKKMSFIDTTKIGLLSWSLGGSAITKAAMLSHDFKCLLSFDGTEIHYYGTDTAWDRQFNQIMKIPPFDPGSINIPYMYLSSEHPKAVDSIYVFPKHINSMDKYFLQFNRGIHENFSSIVTIAKNVAPKLGNIDSNRHDIICRLTLTYFNQYLKQIKAINTADYISKLVENQPAFFRSSYPGK